MTAWRVWADMDVRRGGEKEEKKPSDECLSILFLTLTWWLLLMLRYTSAAWRLSGKTWKQGWSATGHRGVVVRLTPRNDPLPHLHTKELAPLFWILLINTCIEALSIQGPIQGKNFLSPIHPPFFPSPLLPFLPFPFYTSFFLSLHSFCFIFFFSSVGSVWISCPPVSVR